MTVQHILTQNVERILRRYSIRKQRDFQKLPNPITDRQAFLPLQKKLSKLPFVCSVKVDFCAHSMSSSYIKIRFRGRNAGGMSVHLSHHFKIFYASYVTPESFDTMLTWKMTRKQWMEALKICRLAERRKVPSREKAFTECVLDEIVASGWLHVPDSELSRRPRHSTRIPLALRPGSFAY
jgi:hypothetical protein